MSVAVLIYRNHKSPEHYHRLHPLLALDISQLQAEQDFLPVPIVLSPEDSEPPLLPPPPQAVSIIVKIHTDKCLSCNCITFPQKNYNKLSVMINYDY